MTDEVQQLTTIFMNVIRDSEKIDECRFYAELAIEAFNQNKESKMNPSQRTQKRYEQIKQILRGPFLIRHFDMVKGALVLKEEQAETLSKAIVIDFEKQGRK